MVMFFQKFFPKNPVKIEGGVELPKGRGRRPGRRNKSKLVEEPGKYQSSDGELYFLENCNFIFCEY